MSPEGYNPDRSGRCPGALAFASGKSGARLSASGKGPHEVDTKGLALGLTADDAEFARLISEATVPLVKGDRFIIYTDGLSESNDPGKNEYGTGRLFRLLMQCRDKNLPALIAAVMDDPDRFTKKTPAHDDLTVLAME